MKKLYAIFTLLLMSIPTGCDRDKGEEENAVPVDEKVRSTTGGAIETGELPNSKTKESSSALTEFLDPFLITANGSLPCPAHLGKDEDHRKITPCAGQISHSLGVFSLVSLKSSIADLKRQGGFGKGGWYLTSDTRINESEDRQMLVLTSLFGQRLIFKRKDTGRTFVSSLIPGEHLLKYSQPNSAELTIGPITMSFERIAKNELGVVKVTAGPSTLSIGRDSNGFVKSLRSVLSDDPDGRYSESANFLYEAGQVVRINSGTSFATFSYENSFLSQVTISGSAGTVFTKITTDPETGLVGAISNSIGGSAQYSYYQMIDGSYAIKQTADALNHSIGYEYSKNQLRQTSLTAIKDIVYDEQNRMTSVTENGLTEKFTYDERGNIRTREDSLKRLFSYFYDNKDQVVEIRNQASGIVTKIRRDSDGRIAEISDTSEDGSRTQSQGVVRDNMGNVTSSIVNGVSSLTTLSYYDDGKLKSSTSTFDTITYMYDEQDRLISRDSARFGPTTTQYQKDSVITRDAYGRSSTRSFNQDSSSATLPNGNRIEYRQDGGTISTELVGPSSVLKQVKSAEFNGSVQNYEESLYLNNQKLTGNRSEYLRGLHQGSFKDSYLSDVLREPSTSNANSGAGTVMALANESDSPGTVAAQPPVSTENVAGPGCNQCLTGPGGFNGTANEYDLPPSGPQ